MSKQPIKCTRCGEALEAATVIQLELSNTDNRYYREIPDHHHSQGYFPFGLLCAQKQLKQTALENAKPRCGNCLHWRHKSSDNKGSGWGICDNPKNKVYIAAGSLVAKTVADPDMAAMILDSIRYPENFGCIFFEQQG
jgi:hypothetical protein